MVHRNLPLATGDHLGHLIQNVFPDSGAAADYSSARTKTPAILNETFGLTVTTLLWNIADVGQTEAMARVLKMNPVSVLLFDITLPKE